MSNKHLKLSSHQIVGDPTAWWYEESGGICMVQEYRRQNGELIGTRSMLVPWRAIRAALARKDKR